jgi:hypothetical protein
MARKIFAAVGGGYASLFYAAGQVDRNSRWMCIATGVAYSQNIVLGYDGTLPRHSPSFATMFLQIRNEPFHSYLLPVVDDCLHRIGFRNQTAVVTIQTIGPSHDHQPTAWQVRAVLLRLLRCFEIPTRDSFNLDIEPSLPATQDDASGNSLYIQQSFHGMYTENNILSAFRQVKPVFHDIYGRVKY